VVGDFHIPIPWIALVILTMAVWFDLRTREIPDALSVCLLILGLIATGFHLHSLGWMDLAAGIAIGLAVGAALFWLGGFGGGDVKLLASLGAVLGFKAELGVMFYVAILGALFGIAARLRQQHEFAYAPAIALGLLTFIIRGYFR
jgi:leader peptidase (prepilin peptidase)/N-methyltransferase